MPKISELSSIKGVYTVSLESHSDPRGRFTEIFRKEWFPFCSWDKIQSNRSDSNAGVLRGLHYHHQQADYWYVFAGAIRAALYDLRPSSPTCKAHEVIEIKADEARGIFIPPGVIHGFLALTDVSVTYFVNNYYDGSDELGVAWNDPELGIDWGTTDPILSDRDQKNSMLKDISKDDLPK